jgi:hypothetical protein
MSEMAPAKRPDPRTKDGWINRHEPLSSSIASSTVASSGSSTTGSTPDFNWRLTRAIVKKGSLFLYKPPPDVAARSFDPLLPSSPVSTTTLPKSPSIYGSHKRIVSSVSLPPKAMVAAGLRIGYRGLDAHPELEFNSQGQVINGSMEAICHTIIFGDDDEFASTAVLTIPLMGDMVTALTLMKEYVATVRSATRSGNAIASRVQLIINNLLTHFKGMLLNTAIHGALQQLADSVSCHNDQIATALKLAIYQEHQRMNKLLTYSNDDSEIVWSMHHKTSDHTISEKLRAFLSHVEASPSNDQRPPTFTLPPDLFLELTSTDMLATQISCFHLKFYRDWSPAADISLLFKTHYDYSRYNPLVFDSYQYHFLGGLLIDHLLSGKYPKVDNMYRGRLLTHWINLGNALKSVGDLVGWIAILTVLCSPPILRLRASWTYVPSDLRDTVGRDWGHELFELDRRSKLDLMAKRTFRVSTEEIGVTYPKERSISYFGDLSVKPDEGANYRRCQERVSRVKTVINSWKYFFDRIPQNDTFGPPPQPNGAIQKLLYVLLVQNYDTTCLPPDEVLRMSLTVEPATFGNYLKYHYSQQSPIMNGSYLPLVFTDTNPSYKLFSKSSLLLAFGSSSSNKRTVRNGTGRSVEGGATNFHNSSHSVFSSSASSASSTSLKYTTLTNLHRSNSFPPTNSQWVAMTTGVMDVDLFSREFFTKITSRHTLMRNVRDVLNMGAKLYHINDDIVLKALPDDKTSRPSSMIEAPSKHMSASSRRMSAQFMTQSVSPRTSADVTQIFEQSSTTKVVVKSANLERLVDLLVIPVNGFASFVSASDLEKSVVPDFRIDMNVQTLTFFGTYRSFCSPLELLSSLRKRFVGARSAAVSIIDLIEPDEYDDASFPNWDPVCEIPLDNNRAWGVVAQIQIGVLEACHLWVSQYFNDFADDMMLREQFLELIEVFGTEIIFSKDLPPSEMNEDYKSYLGEMEIIYKKARNLFYKKSYRPNDIRPLVPSNPVGVRMEDLMAGNSEPTFRKIEKLVNDLNLVAAEYFSMVSLKEWIELFEVLELQSAEITGFFHYHPPSYSNEDEAVIQDIFTYFDTLYREKPELHTLDLFPKSVQELFRLHNNIVNYLTYQIADTSIHKDERIARMMTVMKMLGIVKTRMSHLELFPADSTADQWTTGISTNVPAFLESCIISAVLRPESRMFANCWMQTAKDVCKLSGRALPNKYTSFEFFVPVFDPKQLTFEGSDKPLTPCVGWMIERMLEIVCYVPNMSVENSSLINFDKRRYVYNLISNITEMKGDDFEEERLGSQVQSICKRLAYIINPEQSLYIIERKALKDALNKELKEYPKSAAKNRVFTSYVTMEIDKIKRDSRQRDFIERQNKELKKSTAKLRSGSSVSLSGTLQSGTKGPRSRFGGLLKAVRPLSMAFSGGFMPTSDRTIALSDLPEISSISEGRCKLQSSINLADCDIMVYPNHKASGVFKIILQDGSELVLQAPSEADTEDWVRVASFAKKYAQAVKAGPPSTKVFGVPIQVLCEREGRPIPRIVETLLHEIESRGLDEVGLYRVSGSLASVNALKAAFDAGHHVNMEDDRWFDINTVAGCFKLYLRELSEPLLTNELFPEFVTCAASTGDEGVARLRRCIKKLPPTNYNLLKRLLEHLDQVAQHEVNNKMKTPNLAIVFSMSFLPSGAVDQMRAMQNVVNTMILCQDRLFSDEESDEDKPSSSNGEDDHENRDGDQDNNPQNGIVKVSTSHADFGLDFATHSSSSSPSPAPTGEDGSELSGDEFSRRPAAKSDSYAEVSAY